ncbi:MAG: L-serine ammonia-lyase, iron-sulfur-dependent, subunit alpha [Bacteroidales bacterium]|nr:L-serine ammonia-lyase, iron-sulfur-dependent, subunit alpha [Bacteroidales bacterium]
MDSIKNIYKIGAGPSSSHTIGPSQAAALFRARNPETLSFRVTLYGSLAATGRGHMTDKAISNALAPAAVEIVWRADIVPEYHTNGMLFEALDGNGSVKDSWMVYSVGGGCLSEGPLKDMTIEKGCYPMNKMSDIQKYIAEEGLSFWEYVQECEKEDIWDFLAEIWQAMQDSVEAGLRDDSRLPGCLKLRSKAMQYYKRADSIGASIKGRAYVSAYALAVSEQNGRGGNVVTAPSCGSCGIVPSVLYHLKKSHGVPDNEILKALATAGLFGNVIKVNASLSGAEVGCQGEVGSACVMAAVAANQIFGGTCRQIEYSAEMAMEHNLGLTCDPICGLVQIPCIERNPMAALRALDASMYALLGDGSHLISFDKVVDTMKRTGKDLPSLYKETAIGGLAAVDYKK